MWKKIEDAKVCHVWVCACDCEHDNSEVEVTPDWYEENGTPICEECGEDMTYSHTMIDDGTEEK